MSTLDPAEIHAIIQEYGGNATQLVQILWKIQDKYTYIPDMALTTLAQTLNLSPTHIEGVISFYSFFNRTPRVYDIFFSDNIIEHMNGKTHLMTLLMQKLGVEKDKVREDGRVCIRDAACIGMADHPPAALINGLPVTHLDEAKINQIAMWIEAQHPISEWDSDYFQVDNHIQKTNILLGLDFENGSAIKAAMNTTAEKVIAELTAANLRGCGGAGFKLASKWLLCRNAPGEHYMVCNADEGEPGTFKDRVLLQSYPDLMIEGMTVGARVIGAKKGFIYLRAEYRYLRPILETALQKRREQNLLGDNILGDADFSFDIEIHLGAGAYICGAETALLESLEGKRGVPRKRPPPFPVSEGYLQQPTVVNNVETLSFAAKILALGAQRFIALGTAQSKGTKLISVSGDCAKPGIYEIPFGTTVRKMLEWCEADIDNVQAVQNSGAAGVCLSPEEFDRQLAFEDINTTGSFMIFSKERNLLDMIHNFANFFVHESCGFCTPCRVGTSLLKNYVEKVIAGNATGADLEEMKHISHLMKTTSHCGLGMTASNYIADTLTKFPALYEACLKHQSLTPSFDLDAALEDSRQITHRDDAAAHIG